MYDFRAPDLFFCFLAICFSGAVSKERLVAFDSFLTEQFLATAIASLWPAEKVTRLTELERGLTNDYIV